MQMTLKIRWTRHEWHDVEPSQTFTNSGPEEGETLQMSQQIMSLADESTLFIPVREVRVHSHVMPGERESVMKDWHDNIDGPGYHNYLCVEGNVEQGGRLIAAYGEQHEIWYLATYAWLLGPDGATIERIAP